MSISKKKIWLLIATAVFAIIFLTAGLTSPLLHGTLSYGSISTTGDLFNLASHSNQWSDSNIESLVIVSLIGFNLFLILFIEMIIFITEIYIKKHHTNNFK